MITENHDLIIANTDTQIAQLRSQLADITQRINSYHSAIAAIQKGPESRLSEIQDMQADVTAKQEAYNQAVAYGKVAQDTPLQPQAVKNVSSTKKELHTAQKHLSTLEDKHVELSTGEQGTTNELLDQLSQAQAKQKQLTGELSQLEAIKQQTSRRIAEQTLADRQQGYAEHESRVDALRTQLVEAQAALLDHHEQSLQELEGHPDLQRGIIERKPLDNATTRMFEATLWFLDAFMANARDIDTHAKLASLRNAGNGSYQDLLGYLVIHEAELFEFLRRPLGANPPASLPSTRARLQQLLEEYRDWEREQE